MATYTFDFGIKTRVGYGEFPVGGTPGEVPTGTGGGDFIVNSRGAIVPAATPNNYGAVKSFSKAAGETYNLTVPSTGDTLNITLRAGQAHAMSTPADTGAANQVDVYLETPYTTNPGRMERGDRIICRDGYEYLFTGLNDNFSIPLSGYAGGGTITNAGSGYTNTSGLEVAVTGGDGTNGLIRVVVSGNQVVQVHVNDPGIGYQAGNVISAAIPGGSGFQYTIGANWAEPIIITSETPNAGDGGSARFLCAPFLVSGLAAYLNIPVVFDHVDFRLESGESNGRLFFITYRNTNGYGVGVRDCYFGVDDAVAIVTATRIEAVNMRLADVDSCTFYRCRRAGSRATGIGCPSTTSGVTTIPIPDNTVIRNVFQNNTVLKSNGDSYQVNGTKNDLFDNFFNDYEIYTSTGTPHQDAAQHLGYNNYGLTVPDVIRIRRNVIVRGVGNGTNGAPQGLFATDSNPPALLEGVDIKNNLVLGLAQNATILACTSGPMVQWNTVVVVAGNPGGASSSSNALCELREGVGGLVDRNVYNGYIITQSGVTETENVTITDKSTYADHFAAPVWGPFTTKEQAIAAWSALDNGGLLRGDGTYAGALFPDGSWNDGTQYQATPPTEISQSANLLSVTVGQPITITYQLDAAANQSVTITPDVDGVTGDFSAATVVIGVGDASGEVTFTPSSEGTAQFTATNNRSLANPAAVEVEVTSPVVSPTLFTQVADRTEVSLGGGITVTYTLNAPAVEAVTITPGVTGVAGVFSAATVVIPNGQTSGQVTFSPSSHGEGSLTATDDSGLTDPAAIAITVAPVNKGQLLVALGVVI